MRAIVLLFVLLSTVAPAWSGSADEASFEILRDTIRANKKGLVAASLTLTDAESDAFWPLYERYEAELTGVNDRLLKVIDTYTKDYKKLTDDEAKKLSEEYLAVEEDRASLRRKYFGEFTKILPGKKAARFYQIENKMNAVVRYDLAREIPVVEE
jgi:hypothetical protein